MRNRIGGALLALVAVFGVLAATSATTQAQWRDNDGRYNRRDRNRDNDRRWGRDRNRRNRYDRYDRNDRYRRQNRYNRNDYYNRNGSQIEINQGYRQGLNTGASDAQRRQSYSPQRSRHYRNARSQAFLQGFVRGYDQGYRQYASYGNGRYGNGGYRYNSGGIADILGGILGRP